MVPHHDNKLVPIWGLGHADLQVRLFLHNWRNSGLCCFWQYHHWWGRKHLLNLQLPLLSKCARIWPCCLQISEQSAALGTDRLDRDTDPKEAWWQSTGADMSTQFLSLQTATFTFLIHVYVCYFQGLLWPPCKWTPSANNNEYINFNFLTKNVQ